MLGNLTVTQQQSSARCFKVSILYRRTLFSVAKTIQLQVLSNLVEIA